MVRRNGFMSEENLVVSHMLWVAGGLGWRKWLPLAGPSPYRNPRGE